MANRAYKYRIYPTREQAALIARTFGCCRKVWNLMLADRIAHYEATGKSGVFTPAMYKGEHPYLREVDSMALCNEQMNLQRAFAGFFRDRSVGFPRWKSRKRPKQSYTTSCVNGNIRVGGGSIRLPKLGEVRARLHRTVPGRARIKSVTVSRNGAGRYFASVLVELPDRAPAPKQPSRTLGLDYSSPGFYVASDGGKTWAADPPRPYRKAQERLALEQRRLSRMQEGSANWRKQRLRIGRIHQRVADVRRDFIERESTRIANSYDLVAVEDVDLSAMSRSLSFGKAVHDNGFGEFRRRLARKLGERGGALVAIGRWFPSSRLCRGCGSVFAGLELGQGEWECPECGERHDRDAYAAETIRLEGLRIHEEGTRAA